MSLWHFSRWYFNPWTVCFTGLLLPSESNFPQSKLYWPLCGLTNSPIVKYPLNWGMERRRFSQTMASEWQTAFVVSHKMPWCTLFTAVKKYSKSLENCQTFSSRPRSRPRPNVQDQDQDFMIQDQDQDFHFCPRGAWRPKPWSRGLHHWCFLLWYVCFYDVLSSPKWPIMCWWGR